MQYCTTCNYLYFVSWGWYCHNALRQHCQDIVVLKQVHLQIIDVCVHFQYTSLMSGDQWKMHSLCEFRCQLQRSSCGRWPKRKNLIFLYFSIFNDEYFSRLLLQLSPSTLTDKNPWSLTTFTYVLDLLMQILISTQSLMTTSTSLKLNSPLPPYMFLFMGLETTKNIKRCIQGACGRLWNIRLAQLCCRDTVWPAS